MSELSVMMFDDGSDRGIRCRFINEWFKIDSYLSCKEKILAEIERNRPDVIMMDLDYHVYREIFDS